ncbi:MAG: hypothetical protein ACWIPI_09405 [Polaribacter sp.]
MIQQEIVIKLIGINQDMYANTVFNHYIDWCVDRLPYHNIPLKILVNNESLFNWYLKQFKRHVEDAFIDENKAYISIADNNSTKVFLD